MFTACKSRNPFDGFVRDNYESIYDNSDNQRNIATS